MFSDNPNEPAGPGTCLPFYLRPPEPKLKVNIIDNGKTGVAGLLMARNEESYITRTLDPLKHVVDDIVYLDTGSTDDSIKIVKRWCEENDKRLIFDVKEFVDFSTSRNMLLDLWENESSTKWGVLVDACDELLSTDRKILGKKFAQKLDREECSAYQLQQLWQINDNDFDPFENIRIIRSGQGFRYKKVVHEFIHIPGFKSKTVDLSDVIMFQDRREGSASSGVRHHRDIELLRKVVVGIPLQDVDPRDVFYLAQSYESVGDSMNAYKFYKFRSQLGWGFFEEQELAFYRAGCAAESLQLSHKAEAIWWEGWHRFHRFEFPIKLAIQAMGRDDIRLVDTLIELAEKVGYPESTGLGTISRLWYYRRLSLKGETYHRLGKHKEGKAALTELIEAGLAKPSDIANLQRYKTPKPMEPWLKPRPFPPRIT